MTPCNKINEYARCFCLIVVKIFVVTVVVFDKVLLRFFLLLLLFPTRGKGGWDAFLLELLLFVGYGSTILLKVSRCLRDRTLRVQK